MLNSSRLILYQPSEVTAAQMLDYELRNKSFFTPWVPERPDEWFSVDAQELRLHHEWQLQKETGSYRFYLATQEQSQLIIGDCGLSNIVRGAFHSAYMGYKLDEQSQGQGYMLEALDALLHFGFETLRLHRVEANIMPHNTRSIAVAEKLGLKREGYSEKYLCINGTWEDHLRYAIIRENYCGKA